MLQAVAPLPNRFSSFPMLSEEIRRLLCLCRPSYGNWRVQQAHTTCNLLHLPLTAPFATSWIQGAMSKISKPRFPDSPHAQHLSLLWVWWQFCWIWTVYKTHFSHLSDWYNFVHSTTKLYLSMLFFDHLRLRHYIFNTWLQLFSPVFFFFFFYVTKIITQDYSKQLKHDQFRVDFACTCLQSLQWNNLFWLNNE